MFRSIALGTVLSIVAVVGVQATPAAPDCGALLASEGCTCAVPITPGSPVADLNSVVGDVQKTGAANYTPVSGSSTLQVGDGVLLGVGGAAFLAAGPTCQHALGHDTTLIVQQVGSCACIKTTSTAAGGVGTVGVGAVGLGAGGLDAGTGVAALAVGGGTAALLLLKSQEDPVTVP